MTRDLSREEGEIDFRITINRGEEQEKKRVCSWNELTSDTNSSWRFATHTATTVARTNKEIARMISVVSTYRSNCIIPVGTTN